MIIPDLVGRDFDSVLSLLSKFDELQVVIKETKSPKEKQHYTTFSKRVIAQHLEGKSITLVVADV